jgi:hypothetical protein
VEGEETVANVKITITENGETEVVEKIFRRI